MIFILTNILGERKKEMNIKEELLRKVSMTEDIQLNDIDTDIGKIKAVMINEVVPADPLQDYYGNANSDYIKTTIQLFEKSGLNINGINDILSMGIYITNAVKVPKNEYAVSRESIEKSLPYLENELALFPDIKVIMLMGDVAKKSFNMIAKKQTGKNVVPSFSTYRLRESELYYRNIRVMPSYIMTGGSIQIEKSKIQMISEDISVMADLIK